MLENSKVNSDIGEYDNNHSINNYSDATKRISYGYPPGAGGRRDFDYNELDNINIGRVQNDNRFSFDSRVRKKKVNFKMNSIGSLSKFSRSENNNSEIESVGKRKDPDKSGYSNRPITQNFHTPIIPDGFNMNDINLEQINSIDSQETKDEFDFCTKINNKERECDNDYETNDLFIKIKIQEFNNAFYTLVSIASALIYHDLNTYGSNYAAYENNKQLYDLSIVTSIMITSIGVLMFIIGSIFRYLLLIKLEHSTGETSTRQGFFSRRFFFPFSCEVLLALLHPNLDISYTTNKTWYLLEVTYNLNDFFILLLLARIYAVFRFFISMNKYYNSRSARVAKMIGSKLTRIFAVRCIIVVYPYTFLIISGSILVLTLAFMLRIVEGPVYYISPESQKLHNDYRPIQNCVWNILVTMTTVGYGDYFPLTNLGRLINIIASLIGTTLVSLMVISLQNSLKFSDAEQRAFDTKERLEVRKEIEKKAGLFFKVSFDFLMARNRYKKALREGCYSRKALMNLKKNVEDALYIRIQVKKDFKKCIQNIYETVNEVDLLKGKLDDIQQTVCSVSENTITTEENINRLNELLDMIEHKIKYKPEENELFRNFSLTHKNTKTED